MHAELILTRGRILTMGGRAFGAAAVLGGRIAAVGDPEDIADLRGPRTRVIDLDGRLALPGFTDSHVHLNALARRMAELDLRSARSLKQALRRVAARARDVRRGEWITGGGFDKNRWGDTFPTCRHLDFAAPDHPVAIRSRDGHSLWVNSAALKLCRITRRTRLPSGSGGVIMRDGRGDPSGILQEAAADLVWRAPAFKPPHVGLEDLRKALRFLMRRGITSAHLMEEAELFGPLQELRRAGKLGPRITLYPRVGALDDLIAAGVRSGFGDEWLRIGGIKLLVDGALGSQTAWMFRPYENSEAGCGVPLLHGAELRDIVGHAARAGLGCAIHAIGDRANAEALDALGEVRRWPTPLRHRIEHAQLLRPRDIPRFARLGFVASMQPCHILGDIEAAERYWGRRSRWAYPIRSLLRAGVALAFGSDAPVETADVAAGLYAATRRQGLDGRPPGGWYRAEEGVGVLAALRAYTVGPAAATGEAEIKGRLDPGYLADIVVLSEDITRVRGRRLLDTRVEMVFTEGRLAYRRRGR